MQQEAPQIVTEGDADVAGATGPDRRRVMMLGAAAGLGAVGAATVAGCGSETTGPLAKLADVPVGGSYASAGMNGQPIVIAQPEAGRVVAFSASCTHAGCKVKPKGKTLACPCHNSTFDAFTGQVIDGLANAPLPAVAVKINGSDVVLV